MSTLPPVANRAITQVEATVRGLLVALSELQRSARWRELQATLDRVSRAVGGEGPVATPVLFPDEGAEAVGALLRLLLSSPAVAGAGGPGQAVFNVSLDEGAAEDDAQGDVLRFVNALQVSATVRSGEDGAVSISLEAGGTGKTLLSLEARPDRLDVVLDLAAARAGFLHLAAVTERLVGRQGELNVEEFVLEELGGVLALGMGVPAPGRLTVNLDVRRDLRLEGRLATGALHLRVGASTPALLFDLDGRQGAGTIRLDVGAIRLRCPQDVLPDQDGPTGLLDMQVPGLTAELKARAGDPKIVLSNLSLGRDVASLRLERTQLGRVDLNPATGRRASLALQPQAGSVDVELQTPLQLGMDWGTESYTVKAAQGLQFRLAGENDADEKGFLKVTRGELTVEARGARKPVRAAAGKALIALDEEHPRADEPHPTLRFLDVH